MKNMGFFTTLTGMLLLTALISANAFAGDDAAGISMYDDSAYTQKVEKNMNKMHGLFLKAYDKSLSKKQRQKAKKEYFEIAQGLVRDMHGRVMKLDVKSGAALSHTEVLLSTHMTMMLLDMLAEEQLVR